MLHVGLDLSRRRLDVRMLDGSGETVWTTAVTPDRESLDDLVGRVAVFAPGEPVAAAIESMTGARFVHDRLEAAGWQLRNLQWGLLPDYPGVARGPAQHPAKELCGPAAQLVI